MLSSWLLTAKAQKARYCVIVLYYTIVVNNLILQKQLKVPKESSTIDD